MSSARILPPAPSRGKFEGRDVISPDEVGIPPAMTGMVAEEEEEPITAPSLRVGGSARGQGLGRNDAFHPTGCVPDVYHHYFPQNCNCPRSRALNHPPHFHFLLNACTIYEVTQVVITPQDTRATLNTHFSAPNRPSGAMNRCLHTQSYATLSLGQNALPSTSECPPLTFKREPISTVYPSTIPPILSRILYLLAVALSSGVVAFVGVILVVSDVIASFAA